MITKHINTKAILFDGMENDILNRSFNLDVLGAISFHDAVRNRFDELRTELNDSDFAAIEQSGGFVLSDGFIKRYHGSDGLSLYYCKKGDGVAAFAYGESQPMRYKLYLEGIWQLS